MAHPMPPQIQLAHDQLAQALQRVEGRPLDLTATPWAELEKGVIKILGGPFRVDQPEHQMVALGISGVLGGRLNAAHGAFWFPNREAPEGAALGFPDAMIMLSPLGAVLDALARSNLQTLENVEAEIRRALGEVRFGGAGPAAGARLRPEDYMRLFDPGFLQMVALDGAKAQKAWDSTAAELSREVRGALSRAGAKIPPEVARQLEQQIIGALDGLPPDGKLAEQAPMAPRLVELLTHLFASTEGTGFAPLELWQDLAVPLLFIGAPKDFPPLEADELEAYSAGADPLMLFVDLVPYQTPAEEEGLLGAFPVEGIKPPHPALGQVPSLRLLAVDPGPMRPLLDGFDAAAVRDSVQRFAELLASKAEKPAPTPGSDPQGLLEASISLLGDLRRVVAASQAAPGNLLCVRRVTEAEAASEGAIAALRTALSAPRIILA